MKQELILGVKLLNAMLMDRQPMSEKDKARRDHRIAVKVAKGRWKENQIQANPQFVKRQYKPQLIN